MADYTAFLANFLFFGNEFTPGEKDGKPFNYRNLLHLHLDGFNVELRQRPEFMPDASKDWRGQQLYTTDLIIRNLGQSDLTRAKDLSRNVAELLSLASSSEVVAFGYSFPEGTTQSEVRAFVGALRLFRPAFFDDANALKSFLEQVYPTFLLLRTPRKLNVAIDLYVLAQRSGTPIEMQLITAFVLMENLKTTFAQVRGYSFISGHFRLLGSTLSNPGRKLSFQTLLNEMFSAVGMSPTLQMFINLRNELVHSGLSQLDANSKWQMLEACVDLLREYFLRLLGYHGTFTSFSQIIATV